MPASTSWAGARGGVIGQCGSSRWSYVAVGAVGVAFYVYRELLARFFLSLHDYQVEAVRAIEGSLVEVSLRPIGRRVDFVPGQFAMVYLEAKDGWHRHPFTISSAPTRTSSGSPSRRSATTRRVCRS